MSAWLFRHIVAFSLALRGNAAPADVPFQTIVVASTHLSLYSASLAADSGICAAGDSRASCQNSAQEETIVWIRNDGAVALELFWMRGSTGVPSGVIGPGERLGTRTFPGHVFEVRGAGRFAEEIRIAPGVSEYVSHGPRQQIPDESKDGSLPPAVDGVDLQSVEMFTRAVPVRWKNLCQQTLAIWNQRTPGTLATKSGMIHPGEDSTSVSYPGNTFCFTPLAATDGCQSALFVRTISAEQYTYVFDDSTTSPAMRANWLAEQTFSAKYFVETGRQWVGFWPRLPPVVPMLPAEHVGAEFVRPTAVPIDPAPAGMVDPSVLTLQVLSTAPRVFLVPHFISDTEAAHLIEIASSRVRRSTAGQGESVQVSDSRTSRNTFIPRAMSAITERIFRRAQDLLGVSAEHMLQHSEPLQIVHYGPGQRYDAHHDWRVGDDARSRFITLLLYLNNPVAGGHTAFPKAARAPGEPPLVVHPGKGAAVLFYNLLPDGNADELSLHAALPVRRGEKWVANFWVWDPEK